MLYQLGKGMAGHSMIGSTTPFVPPSSNVDLSAKTIALIGDSITFQNTAFNKQEYLPQGYMSMLNIRSGQRYHFPPHNNLGVSGDSIAQIDNRKTSLANLTQTPDIVFVLGGTNDTPAGTTEASMIKGLQSIYNYIINVIGAKVVALTIPPRNQFPSGAPLTSAHQTKLDNVNNWILSQSGDITPIDIYTILQDGSNNPVASYFDKEGTNATSYVHPNPLGAYLIARRDFKCLNATIWYV